MSHTFHDAPVDVFSTCPPSHRGDLDTYAARVEEVARWSEESGCRGTLVYTDNKQLDPWLVAQIVAASTEALSPLVAVQPVYMHPYSVAKLVTSLSNLHGRPIWLNMVAGGFVRDLEALGDDTPHDRRYDRLLEYATIVRRLADGEAAVGLDGDFYSVEGLSLQPVIPDGLAPRFMVSGSSDAGRAAARALGATAVRYPAPAAEEELPDSAEEVDHGIRVGVIARQDDREAWAVAHRRFPTDRRGQLAHQLAMKVSDSEWHRRLSDLGQRQDEAGPGAPYWMVPFENYKTFCPYLVGSHETVGLELSRYVEAGFSTLILDVPREREDLQHTARALSHALRAEAA